MAKTASNSTLGAGSDFTAQGPARGFRSGERDDSGMKIGGAERAGLFDGGIGGFFRGGGLLGGILGGGQQFGYTDPQGNRVSALQDMINGGGAGRAGDTFQGGLLSGLLNTIGVRPAGYRARQAAMQMGDDNAPSVMAPSPASTPSTSFTPAETPSPTRITSPATTRPLTAQDIMLLQSQGMARDALVGENATPDELRIINARMGQFAVPSATNRFMSNYGMSPTTMGMMSLPTPSAPNQSSTMAAPTNPALLSRATPSIGDLEAYLSGQPNPMTSTPSLGPQALPQTGTITPQTDPRVSRSFRTMVPPTPQIQGFRPFPDTTPPRPVDPSSLPAGSTFIPANQFTRNASSAYRDMQLRALAAQGLLPQ